MTGATKGRRLAVAIFGRVNSGKSSLLNYLTGQKQAIVSATPGTTTDVVEKAMELPEIGPVLFLDTAGVADDSELGVLRSHATEKAIDRADAALLLFHGYDTDEEISLAKKLAFADTPIIAVVSRADSYADKGVHYAENLAKRLSEAKIPIAAVVCAAAPDNDDNFGRDAIIAALQKIAPDILAAGNRPLTAGLCAAGDTVLLVMPQDSEAPVGRLILPQVETIRELLDKNCTIICATDSGIDAALASLKGPPQLIITDSQVFGKAYAKKPPESKLTSFSILFAAQKGDIDSFTAAAKAMFVDGGIQKCQAQNGVARIVIAEACTHVPLHEDIGRVKIPRLLQKKFGENISIEFVNGCDFPQSLDACDLVIHCGACMFNRKLVMSRLALAKAKGVPMTNYGLTLAALNGILDKVTLPIYNEK